VPVILSDVHFSLENVHVEIKPLGWVAIGIAVAIVVLVVCWVTKRSGK
jgi:hypothetical protein